MSLVFYGYCEVIRVPAFNMVSFNGVLLASFKFHPVTHGFLVFVGKEILTPVNSVGVGNFFQNWCNWRSGVEGVGLVEFKLALVITGDVEPVLSSFRGLEIALEKVSESVVFVTQSFKRSVNSR